MTYEYATIDGRGTHTYTVHPEMVVCEAYYMYAVYLQPSIDGILVYVVYENLYIYEPTHIHEYIYLWTLYKFHIQRRRETLWRPCIVRLWFIYIYEPTYIHEYIDLWTLYKTHRLGTPMTYEYLYESDEGVY